MPSVAKLSTAARIALERDRVLEIVDDAEPCPRARGADVGGALDLGEQIGMGGDQPVPAGDALDRFAIAVVAVADRPDGGADQVDPPLADRRRSAAAVGT